MRSKRALATVSLWASPLARGWRADRCSGWSRWVIAAALFLSSCERDQAIDRRFTTRGAPAHASTAISDSAINQAVVRSLREGLGIDASRIVATTKGGIVELTGEVATLFAKGRAVQLARSVNGVRAVHGHVAVELVQRPDQDLTTDVSRALVQIDLASSSRIAASARAGVVTLTGCVRSRQAREIAGRIAESARGAREVRNQLTLYNAPGRCSAPVAAGDVRNRTDSGPEIAAPGRAAEPR